MSMPQTKSEYLEKFARNQKFSGSGLNTTTHYPCPACAEPEFMTHKVLEVEETLERGATCRHCKRGFKAIINRTPGGVTFEFVQTQGDDLPDWLPKMRRV